MTDTPRDIRGLLITVTGGRLLLPNANVSEIITAATPEPVPGAPPWLLGRVRWRGWRVPLVSFALLASIAERDGTLSAKVVVLKALGGRPRMPFIALLCLGFPRLTTVSPELLVPVDEDGEGRPGVRMGVLVRDDPALIPDLPAIESLVAEALDASAAA
ncbi:MAG: chemotaxis protein CheW [Pseudomonadota bacterium]|jgi:chemosensory pili system protein ChpC